MNLYHYEHLPLDEFVKHADQLLQCKQGLHTFSSAHTLSSTPVSPPPHNQHVINELLESRLKSIQECVNNLADSTIRHRLHNMPPLDSNSFPPGGTGSPSERPNLHSCDTSSHTNTQAAKSLCYFHSTYGDRAYRCTGHGVHSFGTGPQPGACRCAAMVISTKKLHLPRCSWTAAPSIKQQKPSLSCRPQTSRPPSTCCATPLFQGRKKRQQKFGRALGRVRAAS